MAYASERAFARHRVYCNEVQQPLSHEVNAAKAALAAKRKKERSRKHRILRNFDFVPLNWQYR